MKQIRESNPAEQNWPQEHMQDPVFIRSVPRDMTPNPSELNSYGNPRPLQVLIHSYKITVPVHAQPELAVGQYLHHA